MKKRLRKGVDYHGWAFKYVDKQKLNGQSFEVNKSAASDLWRSGKFVKVKLVEVKDE